MTTGPVDGLRVLVVEDDYLIAMDLVDMLAGAGAIPVGPAGTEAQALALMADPANPIDLVILDVDLRGTPSYGIADALTERAIPFVFATGFSAETLDPAYRGYQRLEKPVSEQALLAVLRPRR